MTDFAELSLGADTAGLKQGERAMDDLARKGDQTERRVTSQSEKMGMAFRRLAPMIGAAVAALGAGAGFAASIREAEKFETTMFRVEAVIRATGGVAGRSADQLREQARGLAASTLESTEGVLRAQQTMLTFRNIQGDVFDRAIVAAADMSAALGGDLNSAALQLSKALENPIQGVTALTESGTVFTQAQRDMIRSMVEAGQTAEAQNFILAELEAQYSGTAAAAAGGLAGAQDTLGQAMQELRLVIGDALLPAVTDLNRGLARLVDVVAQNVIPTLQAAGVLLVGLAATQLPAVIAAIGTKVIALGTATTALGVYTAAVRIATVATATLGGPLGIMLGLVSAGAAAWLIFRDNTNEASPAMDDAKAASDALNTALGTFTSTGAPQAGQAAINLANDYRALAAEAYVAADAQLAEARARLAAFGQPGGVRGAATLRARQAEVADAEAALNAAQGLIDDARNKQRQAVGTVTGSMSEVMTQTVAATADVVVSVEAVTDAIAGTGTAATEAAKVTEPAVQQMEAAWMGLARDGVGRAVDWMVGGFKGGLATIKNIFMDTLRQMIATAARNRIMISLGMGGGGGIGGIGGIASAATSILGGGGGMGGAGGLLAGAGALGSAFMGGASFFTSGVASGFAAGGIGGAISGGASALATAASGASLGLGGAAAALGAVALPVAAVAFAVSAFRTKITELDNGIRLTSKGMDNAVDTFRKIEKSRFFGLSKSTSTSFKSDPNNPVAAAASEIQQSVADAARTLGFGADTFRKFRFRSEISLKGLSEDEKIAKVNAELAKMGDNFAALVPGMSSMNEVINAANEAVARAASMGGSRFESQMLAAAARRGEITVGSAGPGGTQSSSLIRLQKIEEVERKVEENTNRTAEIQARLLRIFERWDVAGLPGILTP